MSKEYTDDEIIEMLQKCQNEHGACTPKLFNGMSETCSTSIVIRRFGSWLSAKGMAGLEDDTDRSGRDRVYSDEDVLDHLQECAERNNGRCTVKLLQAEDDLVAPSVAVERFGSWNGAKAEAGLNTDARKTNHRPRRYTEGDYFELIRRCYEKHGKATQRLFDEEAEEHADHPTAAAVRKRFGSWNEAKAKAGLATDVNREYTDEELLEMLRTCRDRYGTISASVFADDDEFCSPETLQRRFGSWAEAKNQVEGDDSPE